MDLADDDFDTLVGQALDTVPERLASLMDNVVVLVEEDSPPDQPRLLGLYVGIPLTERDAGYTFAPPDSIQIFRRPILERCATREQVVEQVRITVVHEIAHHFGIDDDELHELGYG